MANKLPHERLRIWAGKGRTAGHYSFGPAYHMAKELTEVEHPRTAGAESVAFQMLADEIERCYVPREQHEADVREAVNKASKPIKWFKRAIENGEDWPEPREGEGMKAYLDRRFLLRPCDPEGNPWEVGQQCDFGTITALCWKGDEWLAEISGVLLRDTESIERPVLDADGVACKRGQKVWRLSDGEWFYVEEVKPNGKLNLKQGGLGEMVFNADPQDFTHKEPDTLEKLRDDIRERIASGSPPLSEGLFLQACDDRLTALIERGA